LVFSVNITVGQKAEKRAGENLARSVVKIICSAENRYSVFFSAIPNFFMISAEDVSALTISISLAASNAFFLGITRAPFRASWFPNIWKLVGFIEMDQRNQANRAKALKCQIQSA
jgi:hypothetical protein